jgi:signal transduction histidine kinase
MEVSMLAVNHSPVLGIGLATVVPRTSWIGLSFVVALGVRSFARRGAALVARRGEGLGRERERARLLASMHDTALQTLEAIANIAERGGDLEARLLEVARAARAQATQLRNSLRRADEDPGEWFDALAPLAESLEARSGIRVEIVNVGQSLHLESRQREALLGAVQEALRNIEKHAAATKVNIFVEAGADRLRVVIRDDGQGFDMNLIRPESLGIAKSIIARLEAVGGGAHIETRAARGVRVELWIPLLGGRTA